MARVAALYDIHGNLPALDAVLADVEREAPDGIVVGGDIASGPMPRETLERLSSLPDNTLFIRGNADRALADGESTLSDLRHGDDVDIWVLRDDWAASQLTAAQRDFLSDLPESVTLDIDGLGRTLFCHGSPRSDEEIITRVTSEDRLRKVLAGVEETVVVCGHTHVQFEREVDGVRLINAGSVGMPYEHEPAAYWLLLGPDVSLRRTSYDVEAAAVRFRASAFPDAEELATIILDPTDPAEASAFFEQLAHERAGGS